MTMLPQSSASPSAFRASRRGSASREPVGLRQVDLTPRRQTHDQSLLSEDLFTDALAREFKRADRCEESFALMRLSLSDGSDPAAWSDLSEMLTTTKSDFDLIGWYKQDATIGLIRPLVHLEPTDAAAALAATVQRELARVLSPKSTAMCSIRLDVYSPHNHALTRVVLDGRTPEATASAFAHDVSKRALDIVASTALLGLLAPLFLLVSGLIKLTSKGPIMFRQERVGQDGRPFTMLKFRTMQVNADPKIHQQYVAQFIQSGAAAGSGPVKVFKLVDDPRITPVGQFLRRSSLDEVPQFWNVLRGDMSLVGPRPPLPYEVARYKRWHCRRLLEAKPGITGLWQVTGRSRTTFDEMVRLDLQYARSHSLWTDIKILLATPRAVVSGNGAH